MSRPGYLGVHRKQTHTDTTIDITSNHPLIYQKAAFRTYIKRNNYITTTQKDKDKQTAIIKQMAINDGYNEEFINQHY